MLIHASIEGRARSQAFCKLSCWGQSCALLSPFFEEVTGTFCINSPISLETSGLIEASSLMRSEQSFSFAYLNHVLLNIKHCRRRRGCSGHNTDQNHQKTRAHIQFAPNQWCVCITYVSFCFINNDGPLLEIQNRRAADESSFTEASQIMRQIIYTIVKSNKTQISRRRLGSMV